MIEKEYNLATTEAKQRRDTVLVPAKEVHDLAVRLDKINISGQQNKNNQSATTLCKKPG